VLRGLIGEIEQLCAGHRILRELLELLDRLNPSTEELTTAVQQEVKKDLTEPTLLEIPGNLT